MWNLPSNPLAPARRPRLHTTRITIKGGWVRAPNIRGSIITSALNSEGDTLRFGRIDRQIGVWYTDGARHEGDPAAFDDHDQSACCSAARLQREQRPECQVHSCCLIPILPTAENACRLGTPRRLADAGLDYQRSALSRSELYIEGLPLFARGLVRVPDHPMLTRELRLLERRATRSGRDSVDHGSAGSDDYANSLFGVLHRLSARSAADAWIAYAASQVERARRPPADDDDDQRDQRRFYLPGSPRLAEPTPLPSNLPVAWRATDCRSDRPRTAGRGAADRKPGGTGNRAPGTG